MTTVAAETSGHSSAFMRGWHGAAGEGRGLSSADFSVEAFIRDDSGLDLGDEPYPLVVQTLAEILEGGWHEAFLEWGIGAGKDYASSVFLLIKAAEVLRGMILGSFWSDHGLAGGSRIELTCFAPELASAVDVLYSELSGKAREAPWFERYAPIDDKMKRRIRFCRPGRVGDYWPLEIVPRGRSTTTKLGRNLYAAVIDEAGFWPRSTGVSGDTLDETYSAVTRRLRSRFGPKGQLLMISSSAYEGDMATQKEREAAREGSHVFFMRAPTWEVKPPERFSTPETFSHTERNDQGEVLKVWEGIPEDLRPDFDRDPEASLRDYGCKRYAAEQPFDALARALFEEEPPPQGRGPALDVPRVLAGIAGSPYALNPDWRPLPDATYFLHFDLAVSGNPQADGLGVGMLHAEQRTSAELWPTEAFRGEPYQNWVIVVDFSARIMPEHVGGERSVEDTRQLVYDLQAAGVRIGCVSYDGFQSTDSRQMLARRGVTTRLLSVDRDTAPYQAVKRLLHAGRMVYGSSVWMAEYMRLDLVNGKKVDHLPGRSKDASDAVAGATFACWNRLVASVAGDGQAEADARATRRSKQRGKEDTGRLRRYEQRRTKSERGSKRRRD